MFPDTTFFAMYIRVHLITRLIIYTFFLGEGIGWTKGEQVMRGEMSGEIVPVFRNVDTYFLWPMKFD